ncbi:MAG: hypothetical protein DRJ11_10730 [Candidatus Aminicenantes bacterium]|nr:MAG: hypothetical protein DRJ11_10730 [Candidatus Aminicenantes bacterium]
MGSSQPYLLGPTEQGIGRNTIRKDALYFALPALLVLPAGLVFSERDGWARLMAIEKASSQASMEEALVGPSSCHGKKMLASFKLHLTSLDNS